LQKGENVGKRKNSFRWLCFLVNSEKYLAKRKRHMSNYLKKLLFTLVVLSVPYMNSMSQAMFVPTAADEEAAAMTFPVRQHTDLQDKLVELSGVSTITTLAKEDLKGLMGYGSELWESTLRLSRYASSSLDRTLFVGALLACYTTAAVASCECTCIATVDKQACVYAGPQSSNSTCQSKCGALGWKRDTAICRFR
jgi:hypothetical protein